MQAAVLPIENLRIMLVDDDDSVREALTEILSRRGWLVEDFASAEGAIAALKRQHYGVILADVNMPGLSGMDFLHLARESAPDVPVVMITGYPSIDLAVESIKFGAVDFLQKPFKAEELEIVIRKAAGNQGSKPTPGDRTRAIGTLPELAKKRLEDKIKELSILHTISESLDEVSEKEDIFRKTMDIAQIIADADSAFIMVVEHDSEKLVVRGASGYDTGDMAGMSFALSDEPFRGVLQKRCYTYYMAQGGSLG
ncbi:partial Response regulator protein TodT, partial [Planctomycetaceae bacterium]